MTLREIHKFQKTKTLLIRKLPFQRVAREIEQDRKSDLRIQAGVIEELLHTAEGMLVELFEKSQRAAVHAECVSIMPKYIKLATRILRRTGSFLATLGISRRES